MKITAFEIPIFKYKVSEWQVKKKKLLDLFDSFDNQIVGNVITSPIFYKTDIFSEEMHLFEKEVNLKLKIDNIWFQKYETKMDHGVHNHGSSTFSSVCFIEYEKNFHSPTIFVSPFTNNITNEFITYAPNVEEGDIIFFPSNLLHYAPPNFSNKHRTIISFNLLIDNINENKIKYNYSC